MRNLFLFIAKNSNFLLFIGLEVIAFLLIGYTHPFQRSTFWGAANAWVTGVNNAETKCTDYFSLVRQNETLNAENALLRSQLAELQQHPQTYSSAKVVDLTTASPHNYLTINQGYADSVEVGMGVVCQEGIVGVVEAVNEHYSLVIPAIHTENRISCRLQRSRDLGYTVWNGHNYRFVNLMDIARHVEVQEGDTVVTSGLSGIFEEGIPVGIVDKVNIKDGDNYQTIRVRLCCDYHKVEWVKVIRNKDKSEFLTLVEQK